LCHHDVKPSNVAVYADGRVRLIDFGFSSVDCCDRTSPEYSGGTKFYASLRYDSIRATWGRVFVLAELQWCLFVVLLCSPSAAGRSVGGVGGD
jgi:serine/threonine protein kinase